MNKAKDYAMEITQATEPKLFIYYLALYRKSLLTPGDLYHVVVIKVITGAPLRWGAGRGQVAVGPHQWGTMVMILLMEKWWRP